MTALKDKVFQFNVGELPGQPIGRHMGTYYLVNELYEEVERLTAQVEHLKFELDKHNLYPFPLHREFQWRLI